MGLVVLFGALGLNVLLDGVNLGLVRYQTLLLFVESFVDVTLQNLVLAGVVLHGMVGCLLAQTHLILADQHLDVHKPLLLVLEVLAQLVCLRELVLQLVFHLLHARNILFELGFDRTLEVLVL